MRYTDANLENVLNAAAGLLVLLVYLCQDELLEEEADKLQVRPDFRIFSLDNRYVDGPMSFGYTYHFPDLIKSKPGTTP